MDIHWTAPYRNSWRRVAPRVITAGLAGVFASAASAQVAQQQTLQEISVEAARSAPGGVITSNGFVTGSGRTATKTDTPLLETPQSISTVTQKQIDDRKPQTLLEALGYTPGATVGSYGFDPRYDAFTVRGIDMTNTGVFRDGLRQINSPNGLFRLEPYGLEAISILRGPAASLYGASSTGGIVDLISKRPTAKTFGEVEIQGGSYGRKQGAFDFSGPMNENGTVLYRLTALAREAGTAVDVVKDDRAFIAPAITFMPTANTKLTLLGEYMDSTTGGTAAYVNNYVGTLSVGATSQIAGDSRYNDFRQSQSRIGYEFEHRFNDVFTFRQNVRYSALHTNQEYFFAGSGLVRERNSGVSADSYLESRFRTGAVEHQLLTGLDISRMNFTSFLGFDRNVPVGVDPALTDQQEQTQTLTGLYVQDQVKWDRWRLIAGGRYDWLSSDFGAGNTGDSLANVAQDQGKATGRVALSYVTPLGIAPYVSYGTSFTPNPGVVQNGRVAQPTTGEQIEAGIKYDVPGTNLSLRGAVFDLRQQNAVVYEVVTGVNQQVQLDLHNRGIELEAVASLQNGWSLQASYSYIDAEITRLTPETEGNQLTSIPYHTASAWLDYTVQNGPARGLGLAAGVRYMGSSFGDNLHRAVIDNEAHTLVDGSVRYELGALDPRLQGTRLQISGTNLLDDVQQVCSAGYCYFNEGRKIIASLRYRW